MPSSFPYANAILDIAIKAGEIIMEYYDGKKDVDVQRKEDNSPVTAADVAANDYIVKQLAAITPNIPIVAEENDIQGTPDADHQTFWLVDPLDGTKSFINKSGEFTVNIGLIKSGTPAFGVIYVPAKQASYFMNERGNAFKRDADGNTQSITTRTPPSEGMIAVASKSHRTKETDDYINKLNIASLVSAASSLKFCLVAEGKADIYPRFGRTMEWDTAAGHAIVLAAGGTVETEDGNPLGYNKPDFANPYFIVKGRMGSNS